MRNFFLWLACLCFVMLILFSCKKETTKVAPPQDSPNEKLIPMIKSWLDEQKKSLSTASSARIDSLKLNLNYDEISLEKYKESNELIVIPILSGFKSKNNSDKSPVNYLVLVFENQDSIIKGNIIQYISSNNQKVVPQNAFYKIFTYHDPGCNGQFTILSITDYFQYELKFENGKLKSVTELNKKVHPNDGAERVNECIDWYLQIWYVWSDGFAQLISETYVFTTCEGDCAQPRIVNGRNLNVNCNGGGGGGGNEYDICVSSAISDFQFEASGAQATSQKETISFSSIDDITKYKNPKWTILRGASGWTLRSEEIGVIKLIDPTNNKWAWKSLTHGSISMEGSPLPTTSIEYNQGVGTPSFTAETATATTVLFGGMSLNFNVTYRLVCNCPNVPLVGWFPPIIRSYTSNA
ncbi:MAG: hypothetical protein E6H08_05950 [Bacteroidetes bacterium]|nr:MAG: hypothetical protein E6H08_05950 [Bacteroidota bacterium]